MKVAILITIIALGLIIPLYWIIGSLVSAVYFLFHGPVSIRRERTLSLNPHLGMTMADGGKPLDEKSRAEK
jgi:hypothetical protein